MSKELTAVLSAVRKLTAAERRQVVLAVEAQDGVKNTNGGYVRNSEDWLLPGIESELKRQGLFVGRLTPDIIKRFCPSYEKDSAAIRMQLKAALKRPNHAELLVLGKVCARALIDYVRADKNPNITIGPKRVLQAVPDLGSALEYSYPGYLAASKLSILL